MALHVDPQPARARHQRDRQRPLGPGGPGRRASGIQAPRRMPRPGEGVCQHLPQHGDSRGVRRARAGVQGAGLYPLQDPPLLLLGSGDRACRAGRQAVPRGPGPGGVPAGARGGGTGDGAELRSLGHLPHPGGSAAGRPRAAAPRLLLVRAADAGVPRGRLRTAHPRAGDSDSGARDRRRQRLQPRRLDPARRLRHGAHRRPARRHHRRPQDRHGGGGVRLQVRDPHGGVRQPAGARRHQRGHLRVL